MSWLTQKEGLINHYKDEMEGTQPIRVLHPMILFIFQNTHEGFFKELQQLIEEKKISNELGLVIEEAALNVGGKLNTPRVDQSTRKVEIHETFLSYLWCCIYSIFVTYVETVDNPRMNKDNGRITHPVSEKNIEEAKEVFNYAKALIIYFQPWDKEGLPNPEIYQAESRDYVEQTNAFYTEAVKFILCHEITHLDLHIDKIEKGTPKSHFIEWEMEADNNAIDLIKKGISYIDSPISTAHRLAAEIGIITGLLSMFFFKANTDGAIHPNAEDRLTNALERLNSTYNFVWGFACVGLQMWDEQFGLKLKWSEAPIPYKEQYYDIVTQIKAQQQS